MLVSTPKLVQMHEARVVQDERAKKMEPHDHPLFGGGVYPGGRNFREATAWGNIGDPTQASGETGEKLYQIITDWICMVLKRDGFVSARPPRPSPRRRTVGQTMATYEIVDLNVSPGERAFTWVPIGTSLTGAPLQLPLHVLHGAHDGPTLAVNAVIHGESTSRSRSSGKCFRL